jgi:uncharacterized protein (TIGR03437 family)
MPRHALRYAFLATLIVLLALPAAAQPSVASIKGVYNVRYLGVDATIQDQPISFSGTITFNGTPDSNGNGSFTVAGTGASSETTNKTLAFLTSGQYYVTSNGMVQITNPFDPTSGTTFANAQTLLFGGVGVNGIVTASSTDTTYCDLLIAIPAATSASAATLSGTYRVAQMEFLGNDTTNTRDSFFSMTADGKGGLGDVTIKGTAQSLSNAATVQTSSAATYTVGNANGTGTMVFPAPSGVAANNVLVSGNKVLYVSQDGNLFIAGGTNTYDMIIGVKALSGNPAAAMTGLYYTAFVENYAAGTNADGAYGLQGSSNILSNSTELGHQRTNFDAFFSYDFTFDADFNTAADGTVSYSDQQYAVGGGGDYIVGAGNGTNYQVGLYLKTQAITSTSGAPFLSPYGVVNAANNIPFTASFSPGEVISLYGSNLASDTATTPGLPFPTTLGGASVTINGTPAPIYYASPTQISVVIPYSEPSDGSFLDIQVKNGGATSNVVSVYSGLTSPGIFTVPAGGIGNGAILHTDYSLVSSSSPAAVGETVQIFLTGLGAVTPNVDAGSAAPSNPLAQTSSVPYVYIDGIKATVSYSGLAPTLGGLYQLNVVIPSGATSGQNVTIEVVTDDADNIQATIPIK